MMRCESCFLDLLKGHDCPADLDALLNAGELDL